MTMVSELRSKFNKLCFVNAISRTEGGKRRWIDLSDVKGNHAVIDFDVQTCSCAVMRPAQIFWSCAMWEGRPNRQIEAGLNFSTRLKSARADPRARAKYETSFKQERIGRTAESAATIRC